MNKYAILTPFLLFLFLGSVSAVSYTGTIESWTDTLTVSEMDWETLDTWTGTLTVSDVPTPGWDDIDTWTGTLTVEEDYVPPEAPTHYNEYIYAEDRASISYADLMGSNGTYSTARTTVDDGGYSSYSYIGQDLYTGTYHVYRSYIVFDLTDVTEDILGATIWMTGVYDNSDTDFTIQLRSFTESSMAFNNATFTGYGATVYGEYDSEDYNTNDLGMYMHLSESGLTYLNSKQGELCYFMLVSDRDMSATTPTGYEMIAIKTAKDTNDGDVIPVIGLQYEDAWSEIDTWTDTLTVGSDTWSDIDTWTGTLTVEGENPPVEPLIPYKKLVNLIVPIALLFIPAIAFASRFGSAGFLIGLIIGLPMLYLTDYASLGMVLLGAFAIVAIYWRMD